MGVVECLNHKLVEPFNVLYEKEGERERHEHILLHQLPCRALYNYVSLLPFAWLFFIFIFLVWFVFRVVFLLCVQDYWWSNGASSVPVLLLSGGFRPEGEVVAGHVCMWVHVELHVYTVHVVVFVWQA